MKLRNHCTVIAIYLSVIAMALSLMTLRMGAQIRNEPRRPHRATTTTKSANPESIPQPTPPETAPTPINQRFTLITQRVYGTDEKARVWVSSQGITELDFRVYQANDPIEFFKRLDHLHQMGEQEAGESEDIEQLANRPASFLELIHRFKYSVYQIAKRYVRSQLRRRSRTAFNDKFRSGDQLPLNVADYARVPLLNSEELTLRGAWRQMFAQLNSEPEQGARTGTESRTISVGKREPGVYLIEAVHSGQEGDLRAYAILIVSDLTMVYKTAPGEAFIYLVDRNSGEPRGDAHIEIVRNKETIITSKTDRNGIMKSRLPNASPYRGEDDKDEDESDQGRDYPYWAGHLLVLAQHGDQFAISDFPPQYAREYGEHSLGALRGYLYTDRPVYRPGQRVYFKGILRRVTESGYELPRERLVTITVDNQRGDPVFDQQVSLSQTGTFSGEFNLAEDESFGRCTITARLGNDRTEAFFEVNQYRKPSFKVVVTAPKQFVPAGEKAAFKVQARYHFGGPVGNAQVSYLIYRSAHQPDRGEDKDDSVLISSSESGKDEDDELEGNDQSGLGEDVVKEGRGRLDSQGRGEITYEVPQADPKQASDFKYTIRVRVVDSSRGAYEGIASVVGMRGSIEVSAVPERAVIYVGQQVGILVRTFDHDGLPVAAAVTLKFIARKAPPVDAESTGDAEQTAPGQGEKELDTVNVMTDKSGGALYSWRVPAVGNIAIVTVVREGNREIRAYGGEFWGADQANRWADFAPVNIGSIRLVPDKPAYQPGETAHVLALLPTDNAHLLVTTELRTVLNARRVDAPGAAVMIDVPIEPRYAPNVYLNVCYVKGGELYVTTKSLAVPARDKFLKIEIIPDRQMYKPRDSASYQIIARNWDDSPARGAEISLGVVDEAVYGVKPGKAKDIRRHYYGHQFATVETNLSNVFHFTGYAGVAPFQFALNKRPFQLAQYKNERNAQPNVRKDFQDTAVWRANLITNADGKAMVKFRLPDNQTTWRATAYGVTADFKVGSAVTKVTARNYLMIRLETPRFVTEGDSFTVSGVVHNYYDLEKTAQVELQVSGATLLGQKQQAVRIAKGGEQRVDWRLSAAQSGKAMLLALVRSNHEADGVELPLFVRPSGTKQTKGAAAAIIEGSGEKTFTLDLPANANVPGRSLRVEATSSIAEAAGGAIRYLRNYPYQGTEQLLSNFLANGILSQVLQRSRTSATASSAESGGQEDFLRVGPRHIYEMQREDGGWGWWKDDKTDLFMTAYAVDGLAMAEYGNYLKSENLSRGRKKIEELINSARNDDQPLDLESQAYLVYAYVASGVSQPPFGLGKQSGSRASYEPPLSSTRRPFYPPYYPTGPYPTPYYQDRSYPVPTPYPAPRAYTRSQEDEQIPAPIGPPSRLIPIPAEPQSRPRIVSPGNSLVPDSAVAAQVSKVMDQVRLTRAEYANSVGAILYADGSYAFIGARPPSSVEMNLLGSFNTLWRSVQSLEQNAAGSSLRSAAVRRIEEDLREVERIKLQAPISADLTRKINSMLKEAQALVETLLKSSTPSDFPAPPEAAHTPPPARTESPEPPSTRPAPRPTPLLSVPAPSGSTSAPPQVLPTPYPTPPLTPGRTPVVPSPYPTVPVYPPVRAYPDNQVVPIVPRPAVRPTYRIPVPIYRQTQARASQADLKRQMRFVNDLYARRGDLQPYGLALLALSLKLVGDGDRAGQIVSELEKQARVTASDIHWESTHRPLPGIVENNDLEATAFVIRALVQINPKSQLLPKAVCWLLAARSHGTYWETTRQTAFSLFALADYLQINKDPRTDYTFDLYLNGERVVSKRVLGAEEGGGRALFERNGAAVGGANQIRIVKHGAGALYASVSMDYFTNEERQTPQSWSGLKLSREYLRLRLAEANGKPRWSVEPLSGELRSGDLIVSRLTVQGARGQYLMIEDPIPAGCDQAEDPQDYPLSPLTQSWSAWYGADDNSAQRTVIFQQSFSGDATFQYVLRVQIPGEFRVAPARAELMYLPAVRANTESKVIRILDRK